MQSPLKQCYGAVLAFFLSFILGISILPVPHVALAQTAKPPASYPDANAVAAAIGDTMAGINVTDMTSQVRFQSPQQLSSQAPTGTVRAGGFSLGSVVINTYERVDGDPTRRRINGFIIHLDRLTRSIVTEFTTGYRILSETALIIENVNTRNSSL